MVADIVSKWPEAHRRYRCSLHDSRPLRRWTWPWRTLENGELLANYGDNWIYIYYIILYYIILLYMNMAMIMNQNPCATGTWPSHSYKRC